MLAFETEGLLGTGAAPAVLAYLFHRIAGRLDGRPTLVIVDEGWLALSDPGFSRQLAEWLVTLRKKNASVIFATQSLAQLEKSTIAAEIIDSCHTRILLPNDRAIEPQITAIYRRFGLNDRQIEIIARAMPKRDYYAPVPPRQPPVRARSRRGGALDLRRIRQGRPRPDRRGPGRTRPGRTSSRPGCASTTSTGPPTSSPTSPTSPRCRRRSINPSRRSPHDPFARVRAPCCSPPPSCRCRWRCRPLSSRRPTRCSALATSSSIHRTMPRTSCRRRGRWSRSTTRSRASRTKPRC